MHLQMELLGIHKLDSDLGLSNLSKFSPVRLLIKDLTILSLRNLKMRICPGNTVLF
jgi:hypothetical protein